MERVHLLLLQIVVHAAYVFPHGAVAEFVDLRHQSVEEVTVVADHDDRAVETLNGVFEHILRGHVQVVGGLVEDEQVDGFEEEANHGQTAPFAARKHLDGLVGSFAAEHERTQYVADLGADVAHGHAVDGVEHREVLVEELGLVLGKISDFDPIAHLQFAVVGDLSHDALDERRLALAVASHEGHFLAALDGQFDVVEDDVVVSLAHIVADDGIVARAGSRRELEVQVRVVDLLDFDGHDFLELLDAALHLHGLGGLVAEALDKGYGVLNELLLVVVGAALLLDAFGVEDDILRVVDVVVVDAAARDFDGPGGDAVEEGSVVADEQQCVLAVEQEALQPLYRLDVEVVGRLVEEQDVGFAQQDFGEFDAHAPTAGELACRAVEVLGFEAEARQRAFDFGVAVRVARHGQLLVEVRHFLDEVAVLLAFVVRAFGQLLVEALHVLLQSDGVGKGLFGLLPYGHAIGEHHHLGQVADGEVLGLVHTAAGRLLQAGYDFEHCALAGAVLAHQRNAFVAVYDVTDIGEERLDAKLHR